MLEEVRLDGDEDRRQRSETRTAGERPGQGVRGGEEREVRGEAEGEGGGVVRADELHEQREDGGLQRRAGRERLIGQRDAARRRQVQRVGGVRGHATTVGDVPRDVEVPSVVALLRDRPVRVRVETPRDDADHENQDQSTRVRGRREPRLRAHARLPRARAPAVTR